MAGDEEGSGVPAWLNGIVVAQSIVGVVSALLALNILVTLKVGSPSPAMRKSPFLFLLCSLLFISFRCSPAARKVHSYLRFVQYRAVFGVMVGNLFFSLINIIPVAYVQHLHTFCNLHVCVL